MLKIIFKVTFKILSENMCLVTLNWSVGDGKCDSKMSSCPLFTSGNALRKISFSLNKLEKGKGYTLVQMYLGVELEWMDSTRENIQSRTLCISLSIYHFYSFCYGSVDAIKIPCNSALKKDWRTACNFWVSRLDSFICLCRLFLLSAFVETA